MLATLGNVASIAFFNFFGISVTKEMSATTRMVLDSIRTFVIWGQSARSLACAANYSDAIACALPARCVDRCWLARVPVPANHRLRPAPPRHWRLQQGPLSRLSAAVTSLLYSPVPQIVVVPCFPPPPAQEAEEKQARTTSQKEPLLNQKEQSGFTNAEYNS